MSPIPAHEWGSNAQKRGKIPFLKAHSGSCKGTEEFQGHGGFDTFYQNGTWPVSYAWALILDSLSQTTHSFSMKSSAPKEIAQSLFQIWRCFILFWKDAIMVYFLWEQPRIWLTIPGCVLHFPLTALPFPYWPLTSILGKEAWVAGGRWVIMTGLLPPSHKTHEPWSLDYFNLHSCFYIQHSTSQLPQALIHQALDRKIGSF